MKLTLLNGMQPLKRKNIMLLHSYVSGTKEFLEFGPYEFVLAVP